MKNLFDLQAKDMRESIREEIETWSRAVTNDPFERFEKMTKRKIINVIMEELKESCLGDFSPDVQKKIRKSLTRAFDAGVWCSDNWER